MKLKKLLYGAAHTFHSLFAASPLLAKRYLYLWSTILRAVPDGKLKGLAVITLRNINWNLSELKPQTVSLGSNTNVRLTPHPGEFDFDTLFFRHLGYEMEVFKTLEDRATTYDVIIEIGANVGVFTIYFSKMMEKYGSNHHIYAFEPSREAYFRLQQNLRANSASNVQSFNCGVSAATEFAKFYEPEGHLTNGSLYADFASIFSQNIKVNDVLFISGDSLEQLLIGYRSILIKIDVEGAEHLVLRSMKSLILSKKPDIILEVLTIAEEDLNTLDFLLDAYDLFNIEVEGLVKKPKFTGERTRDYLLLPKQ